MALLRAEVREGGIISLHEADWMPRSKLRNIAIMTGLITAVIAGILATEPPQNPGPNSLGNIPTQKLK